MVSRSPIRSPSRNAVRDPQGDASYQLFFNGDTIVTTGWIPKPDAPATVEVSYSAGSTYNTGGALIGVNATFIIYRGVQDDMQYRLFGTTLTGVFGPLTNETLYTATLGWDLTSSGLATRDAESSAVGKGSDTNASDQPLLIGTRQSGAFFTGVIKDVKVYDGLITDPVIHHWPVNDNVTDGGIIKDVIGGLDGILTLGTGFWEAI